MTLTAEELNARHQLRESNAGIVLALSILRRADWCSEDCRQVGAQAQAALLGATVTELDEIGAAS